MDDTLKARWYAVCDRRRTGGTASLSEPERVWVGVRAVLDATGDGGIISYFYNSWANEILNSLMALDAVNALEAKDQIERVAALFIGDSIKSVKSRNQVIRSWREHGRDRREINRVLQQAEEKLSLLRPDLEEKLFNFLKQSGIAI